MTGKVVVITGANTGIGYETALGLARRGAHVVLACRDDEGAAAAIERIKAAVPGADVVAQHLDLASLSSIHSCVERLLARYPHIDVLINNAGYYGPFGRTADGLELCMGVNYVGHFFLTHELFDMLARSNARVINVGSLLYKNATLSSLVGLRSLEESEYKVAPAYSRSKLATMLFSQELQRRFEAAGCKATSNALCPGVVRTALARHASRTQRFLFHTALRLFGKSPEEGAQTTLELTLSPELEGVGGKYFRDCKPMSLLPFATDVQAAKDLWDATQSLLMQLQR